jgi:imidazolonepropionase-like amidohydrolase
MELRGHKTMRNLLRIEALLLLILAAVLYPAGVATAETVAVRGAIVYPVASPAIEDGVVLIEDGKITAVGPAAAVAIPEGTPVLEAAVVTPGLVDAHSTVGLSGIYNGDLGQGQRRTRVLDQDQLERSAPIQPELRAIDAYNAQEPLVAWIRSYGVTTVHTGHGPGALASGQTLIAKTRGDSVEEAVLREEAMVAFTLGASVERNFDSPGTRSKGVALLRESFVKAQEYLAARERDSQGESEKPKPRDLRLETLGKVLQGEVPALITAHRTTEIHAALRLAEEFGFRLVLDGAAEGYRMVDTLKEARVPVIVHPTMIRPGGDTRNFTFENLAILRKAGIPAVLQSGHESYVPKVRMVLLEAAMAVAYGLPFEDGLAAITLDAARLLGIEDRVGSLEVGKDADLVLYDGDPFEYTSHVCTVLIEGAVVSDQCR